MVDTAQSASSSEYLGAPYWCYEFFCLTWIGDDMPVRPALERNEHNLWLCPNCHHAYGNSALPIYKQSDA